MPKIINVKARQVFDSRGNPTVEAEVFLENNVSASAISPSGASTGAFEAYELRDNNETSFLGKSVNNAVENINKKIKPALLGLDPNDQSQIDKILLNLDGSKNKKILELMQHLQCHWQTQNLQLNLLTSHFLKI